VRTGFVRYFEESTEALVRDRGFRELLTGAYTATEGWARGTEPAAAGPAAVGGAAVRPAGPRVGMPGVSVNCSPVACSARRCRTRPCRR